MLAFNSLFYLIEISVLTILTSTCLFCCSRNNRIGQLWQIRYVPYVEDKYKEDVYKGQKQVSKISRRLSILKFSLIVRPRGQNSISFVCVPCQAEF